MATCATYNNGNVVRVTAIGEQAGVGEVVNVYHLQLFDGGPADFEDVAAAAGLYMEALYDLIKLFCNAVMTWDKIRVDGLAGVCTSGDLAFSSTKTGALTNNPVPSGVAALVSLPTYTKRVRMRKYFGVLDDGSIGAAGNIDGTTRGLIEDAMDYLMQIRYHNGLGLLYGYQSPKAEAFVEPHSYLVSAVPAYQRRRRQGTGS